MDCVERGREDVEPEINQRSSAMTARVKTRLVVRRGRIGVRAGVGEEVDVDVHGRDREYTMDFGAKTE